MATAPDREDADASRTSWRDRVARLGPWIGLCLVLAAAAVAYQPALPGAFVLDDLNSIETNSRLRVPDALRLPSPVEMLGPTRPVTEFTFAIDWRVAGLDPRRFHATSLVLHLLAVVAAFAFLSALLRRSGHPRPRAVALVVAGLFALHPIQTESVAYAAQRAEVLSSIFYLLALLLLDRAAATWPGWRGSAAWAGGAIGWVLGMGAKAVAISMPGVFVLDQAVVATGSPGAAPLTRRTLRALLIASPIFALAAVSAVLQFQSFGAAPGGGAGFSGTQLGAASYFLTQLRVQWLYLGLLAWPGGLAFDRTFEPSLGVDGATLVAGAGVLLLLALAGYLWLRAERSAQARPASRLAAFGILFWFAVLSPTSSLVPVVDLAVEHRVYLASLGPFLLAVVAVDALLARLLTRRASALVGAAVASVALLSLALAIDARARTWGSPEALFREAVAVSPDNPRAWTNLGLTLQRRGDFAGAEQAYGRAWGALKTSWHLPNVARNHSALLLFTGRPAEALVIADRGLQAFPGDHTLHTNRAVALDRLGRSPEALAEARLATEIAPDDLQARLLLGLQFSANGDRAGALAEYHRVEALDPPNPVYPAVIGITAAELGRRDEACAAFRRARTKAGSGPLPMDGYRHAARLGCGVPGP